METRLTRNQMTALAVFAILTFLAATLGAQSMPDEWYAALAKPAWNPPSWIFGPVWTVLYVMIALSGFLAWRAAGFGAATALWAAQMAANGLWSWLFFGQKRIDLALGDIVLLLVLILAYIAVVLPRSRPAALLFVPYALWVGFATALNAAIWGLNP